MPREVADALSLSVFYARLDGALRNLVVVLGVPAHGRRVGTR